MRILCRNPLVTRNGRSCRLELQVVFLEGTADLTLFLYALDTDLLPADVGRWRGSSHDPWTTHMIDRSTRLNNDQRRRRQILIVTRENNVAGKQPRTTTKSFVLFCLILVYNQRGALFWGRGQTEKTFVLKAGYLKSET